MNGDYVIVLGKAGLFAYNQLLFLNTLNHYGLREGEEISINYQELENNIMLAEITALDEKGSIGIQNAFKYSGIFSEEKKGLREILQPQR